MGHSGEEPDDETPTGDCRFGVGVSVGGEGSSRESLIPSWSGDDICSYPSVSGTGNERTKEPLFPTRGQPSPRKLLQLGLTTPGPTSSKVSS